MLQAYCFVATVRDGELKGKQGLVPCIEWGRPQAKARVCKLRAENPQLTIRIAPVKVEVEGFDDHEEG